MSEPAPIQPGERLFTALLVFLSLILLWQAFGISGFQSLSSAGMFPMLSALTMVVTGALVLRGQFRRDAAAGAPLPGFLQVVLPRQLLLGALAVVGYMLLLHPLGFLAASLLFLLISMRIFGSHRWLLNVAVSVASLALIQLVFGTVFSVMLPKGTWLQGL